MAQQLRALAAIPGDLGLIPRTLMATVRNSSFRGSNIPFRFSQALGTRMVHKHTSRQKSSYMQNVFKICVCVSFKMIGIQLSGRVFEKKKVTFKISMVTHTCNLRIQESEEVGITKLRLSRARGQVLAILGSITNTPPSEIKKWHLIKFYKSLRKPVAYFNYREP